MKRRSLQRGFYLVPTLFTVGNLLCGFSAIIAAFHGQIPRAALLIIAAGVLDLLDGRIARLTKTTSEFGSEFDSLSDIVSFGIAPSVLAYAWVLQPFGRVGLLVSYLFVVCAAMRLARFNIQVSPAEKRHFVGLSSPVAAASLASVVYAFPQFHGVSHIASILQVVLVATLALLMISRFRYRSFKDLALAQRRSYLLVLPLAIFLIAIVMWPRWTMLAIASCYIFSAPLISLAQLLGFATANRRKELSHESHEPLSGR